jgi:coenzyme F420-0:L-glutamate ligase/coenzyme F420-1:gamma-L-glutamate ligase
LLQGQAAESQPVIVVRGLTWQAPNVPVAEVIRPPEEDLFQ